MSASQPPVSIHPYFRAHAGKRDEMLASLPQFVEKTATEDGCLWYEFTTHGDELFCREGYKDAAAALAHLENVGEMLQQLLTITDLTRLELHGPAAELEELKEPLKDLNPTWFAYECGLNR
ncbi:MAG: hypothetical protein HKN82_19225 [Akkermansiaceae bacterium]|nr:hypothetical protein [Akkermansiaceae bacterium]NNM30035.1 hypothetical protein [Akkermansiaceae bacterium]